MNVGKAVGVGRSITGEEREPDDSTPSLAELFRLHSDWLVRLAYLLTGREAVAEDIVQDVFVAYARHAAKVEHPDAYLRRSVVNAARSWHRRRHLELRHARIDEPGSVSLGARELADALRVLSARERAVIVLHFYEDRSIDEMAQLLGWPRGTIASLQSRGLARLRKVVEP